MTPKYLTVIPTLKDDPLPALASLSAQTIQPARVIVVCGTRAILRRVSRIRCSFPLHAVYVRPNMSEHVGVRVGKAINAALASVDLTNYDYLLKLDAEAILSKRCIEESIRKKVDLVGLGPFMLIRVEPFLSVLHGQWPETPADDAYVFYAFKSSGYKVEPALSGVVVRRKSGMRGGWRYYFYRGADDFRTGINPLTIARMTLSLIRARHTLLPIFTLLGYYSSLIRSTSFYWFAPVVFRSSLINEVHRQVVKIKRLKLKLERRILA